MAETGTPPSGQQPTSPPPPSAPDLTGIQDTIQSLNDQLSGITEKLGDLETKMAEAPAPEPAPEVTPKWQPKTWDEFPQMAEEVARKVVQDIYEADAKAKEETEAEDKATQEQIDRHFDTQIATLEAGGRIPKVANPIDPNDPGRVARKELFGLGIKNSSTDLIAMADARDKFKEAGYTYDATTQNLIKSSPVPFGQTAPVGSSAKTTTGREKPTYKEIHGLSRAEMIRRFGEGS